MDDNTYVTRGANIPFDIVPTDSAAKMTVLYNNFDDENDIFISANRFLITF